MTFGKRTARHYVIARNGNTQQTNHLCGPFDTAAQAQAMLPAVRNAALRSGDERFNTAAFGTTKRRGDCPPGTLRLDLLDINDVVKGLRIS